MQSTKSSLFFKVGVITAVLGLLVFISWLALYSPKLANYKFIMTIRAYYYFKVLPVNTKNILFLTKKTVENNKNIYTYFMSGEFDSMDVANNILYLKYKNNVYGFKYSTYLSQVDSNIAFLQYVDFKKNDPKSLQRQTFAIDLKNPQNTTVPFNKGDIIRVYWIDNRLLTKILADTKRIPNNLINEVDLNLQYINRIKQ